MAGAAILVLTQMPDRASALGLARSLVESRLAACVSIGAPVESLYHWRGKIETAQEVPGRRQDAAGALCGGRSRDSRAAPLRTSGDRRCPRRRWPRSLSRLDRGRNRAESDGRPVTARSRRARVAPDEQPSSSLWALPVAMLVAVAPARRPRSRSCSSPSGRSRSASRRSTRTPSRRDSRSPTATTSTARSSSSRSSPSRSPARRSLPPGKIKDDEFFGKVETYRGQLAVRLPLEGAQPGAMVTVKAESQGCADAGVCYPPQVQTRDGGAAGSGRSRRASRSARPRRRSPGSTERAPRRRPSAGCYGVSAHFHLCIAAIVEAANRSPGWCSRWRVCSRLARRRISGATRQRSTPRGGDAPGAAGRLPAGHQRAASRRSGSGKARCWSSTSGRPGACRAGRRCRSS